MGQGELQQGRVLTTGQDKFAAREKTEEQEGKTMTAIKQTSCQASCCKNIKSGSEKWVISVEKTCERLEDRNLYQALSHGHSRNHEHVWKHHIVLSGAVNFGLNAAPCQGTLKQDLVDPHIQKMGRVISASDTVLIKLEMQSHDPEVPKL